MTIYTRQDCGLCEEAEQLVTRLQNEASFEVVTIDIDEGDEAAYDQYRDRVPVILVDGEEVAEAPIDESLLRSVLTS